MNTLQIFQAIAAQLHLRRSRALAAGADGGVLKTIETEVVGAVMREGRGRMNPAFVRSLVSACLDDDPSNWPADAVQERDELRRQYEDLASVADMIRPERETELAVAAVAAQSAVSHLQASVALCAHGQAFWTHDYATGQPQLMLGFCDIFKPGHDSEKIALSDCPVILAEYYMKGRLGVAQWVAARRNQPILPAALTAMAEELVK